METPSEEKALRTHFNSKARRVKKKPDGTYLVPLKYDPVTGAVLTEDKFNARKHYKTLDMHDWAFLECWMKHEYNDAKAQDELGLTEYNLARLVKKCQPFKQEEVRDKVLANIPTPTFIAARHAENVLGGAEIDDSKHKSLQELAKITGAYKNNAAQINIQQNFLQMPTLTPEQAKEITQVFDTIATEGNAA